MECYFFGTFSPPHIGHIELAKRILEEFKFDKIIFVPAFCPPHKENFISFEHRLNMLKLTIKDNMEVSDIECRLPTPSYSYRTIETILKEKKEDKLNFIIGYDAFKLIKSWKNPEYIKEKLKFFVLKRTGDKKEDIEKLKFDGYDFIIVDNISEINVSSSEVRNKIRKNENVKNFLDSKIIRYIEENELYGN